MKATIKILCIALTAASLSLYACNSAPETKTDEKSATAADSTNRPLKLGEKLVYQCEMDPTVISDKPGKCPKCGMELVKTIVQDSVKTTI